MTSDLRPRIPKEPVSVGRSVEFPIASLQVGKRATDGASQGHGNIQIVGCDDEKSDSELR